MKKIIFALSFVLAISACKPRSGPLERDAFSKTGNNSAVSQKDDKSSVKIEKINVQVTPCQGCIKISDLLENKNNFSGKDIKVTGQVTKFNPAIMGKNWVHIQDGSEYNGEFDLTITTNKKVNVGEVVTFQGKISLDKDFGYGYVYKVLMEDGDFAI